ncbi:MAG: polyhydroxyalkanoate synthesis repressor PhaR [Paracoccaceae bacterium]
MADTETKLLIKRYASRRLYNTETSDYVTLGDIAKFIRAGRDVQIIDLNSGNDLTRQYLLQIIAEHEGGGESVLPIDVLTDLVRGYTSEIQSIVPQFLAASFQALRQGPAKAMENLPIEAMQAQQAAFVKAMTSGLSDVWGKGKKPKAPEGKETGKSELDEIKIQLADLQSKLSKL